MTLLYALFVLVVLALVGASLVTQDAWDEWCLQRASWRVKKFKDLPADGNVVDFEGARLVSLLKRSIAERAKDPARFSRGLTKEE